MPTDQTISPVSTVKRVDPRPTNTGLRLSVLFAGITLWLPLTVVSVHSQSTWDLRGVPSLDSVTRTVASAFSDLDSAIALLRPWYSSRGFFEFRLDSVAGTALFFVEGERYVTEAIRFDPSEVGTVRLTTPDEGSPYSDSLLQAVISDALDQLESAGFALASVRIRSIELDSASTSISIDLDVLPGNRKIISTYRFEGRGNTSEAFLRRVAGPGEGSVYDPISIDRVRARLYRTGLFEPIPYPEIRVVDSGAVDLVFRVRRRSVNSFDGAVGYQPSTDGQTEGYFTGSVDVRLRNVFGGGESIEGSWSKLDESTSDLSLGFTTPYIFGLPFGVDLSFSQIVEDETGSYTSYVERRLRGLTTAELGTDWRIEAGGEFSALISSPDTISGPCSVRQLPMSSSLGALIGIRYDSRDFPMNPRSGALYRSRFGFGTKELRGRPIECDTALEEGDRSLSRQSIEAELLYLQPLGGPIVAAGHVRGKVAVGEEFDISELYRVGGTNTIRGYREGAFRGTRVASATLEGRLLLSEISHAGLFLDGGYVFRPQLPGFDEPSRDDLLLGYGLSFQVDTPAGVARFSVGLARGAPVEEATISVGLVGSF